VQDIITGMNLGEITQLFRPGAWTGAFFRADRFDNSEAARWADAGAPDLALCRRRADCEGQDGRKWFTPAGRAGFQPGVRNVDEAPETLPTKFTRLAALGGLAVCQTLREEYGLPAEINGPTTCSWKQEAAGILQKQLAGRPIAGVILGIGINIAPESVQTKRADLSSDLRANALGKAVDRLEVLRQCSKIC